MADVMKDQTLVQQLIASHGSGDSCCLRLVSDVPSGTTDATLDFTVKLRVPLKELPLLRQHYHDLMVRSGRCMITMDHLVDIAKGKTPS